MVASGSARGGARVRACPSVGVREPARVCVGLHELVGEGPGEWTASGARRGRGDRVRARCAERAGRGEWGGASACEARPGMSVLVGIKPPLPCVARRCVEYVLKEKPWLRLWRSCARNTTVPSVSLSFSSSSVQFVLERGDRERGVDYREGCGTNKWHQSLGSGARRRQWRSCHTAEARADRCRWRCRCSRRTTTLCGKSRRR